MAETAYETKKVRAAERSRSKTKAGQDIGPPPPVVDPARRAAGEASLQRFMELYFPTRFHLAWPPDALQVISRTEEAINHGGLFALAEPRGGGKTSKLEVALLWAALTGRHLFVMMLAVSDTRAKQLMESIKTELLTNDLLMADWPEVCHPVRALEDRANRAKGQHIEGQKTFIGWRNAEVVLPYVAGSQASNAVLRVAGLTSGGVRGTKFVRPCDGATVRPTLVLLDDPQDDEAAYSPSQCRTRLRLIHGAVLGMAGPGKKITAVCSCTVIARGDVADSLLDRKQSPLWTGQRYQLLYRWPERMDLWHEYRDMRNDELRNDGDGHLATAWYGQRKEAMDAGAAVAWPERFQPDELSALQHAMNLFFRDEEAFWSEYQNAPMPAKEQAGQLQADAIAARLNGLEQGIVPLACSRLTAFADVQQKALYYVVTAWTEGFGGAVIDYGTYPDQGRRYFTLADVQRTLGRAKPGAGLEGAIYDGLGKLADQLLLREWRREDGSPLRIERMVVDAGYQGDTVKTWCRQTHHATLVTPSHGKYVGAKSKPFSAYQKKPGDRLGWHWLLTAGGTGKAAVRHLLIDTNHFKTLIAARLRMAIGDRGALTLYGTKGTDHRLFADHCCAEFSRHVASEGQEVDEWQRRPERADNHYFDALVGSAAAASLAGVTLAESQGAPAGPRPKVSFKAMQEARRREPR